VETADECHELPGAWSGSGIATKWVGAPTLNTIVRDGDGRPRCVPGSMPLWWYAT
jgi:hypothetical protein